MTAIFTSQKASRDVGIDVFWKKNMIALIYLLFFWIRNKFNFILFLFAQFVIFAVWKLSYARLAMTMSAIHGGKMSFIIIFF